ILSDLTQITFALLLFALHGFPIIASFAAIERCKPVAVAVIHAPRTPAAYSLRPDGSAARIAFIPIVITIAPVASVVSDRSVISIAAFAALCVSPCGVLP